MLSQTLGESLGESNAAAVAGPGIFGSGWYTCHDLVTIRSFTYHLWQIRTCSSHGLRHGRGSKSSECTSSYGHVFPLRSLRFHPR